MSGADLFRGVRVGDPRNGPSADQPGGVIDDAVAAGFEYMLVVGLLGDGGLILLLNGMPPERAHLLLTLALRAIEDEMMVRPSAREGLP